MDASAADYAGGSVRSNGWFTQRSGADQMFDGVNSRIRDAQRRERGSSEGAAFCDPLEELG